MKKNIKKLCVLLMSWTITCMFASCDKEFLEARPNKALLVPETLDDFRALLDNFSVFNFDPSIAEIASDDYQIANMPLASLYVYERNIYQWGDDLYGGLTSTHWSVPYKQVIYTNIVLDGLTNLKTSPSTQGFNQINGSALFLRSLAYYNLLQIFAPPYNLRGGNESVQGIILKNSKNVNEELFRSDLQTCYERVIQDLTISSELLENVAGNKSRPSKTAALALLSRVYLSIGKYEQAGAFAEQALSLQGSLLDYSTFDIASTKPFPVSLPSDNSEVIFFSQGISTDFLNNLTTNSVATELYDSYDGDDLRKSLYFRDRGSGVFTFKGSYSGSLQGNSTSIFSGLATDELYLNLAEALIRAGKVDQGIAKLNFLLSKRYKPGKFAPLIITDQREALLKVLVERRKSLFSRMTRWADLRRLNQEDLTKKTIIRSINDANLRLLPGDNRYTFPIPDAEVRAGIGQNPR